MEVESIPTRVDLEAAGAFQANVAAIDKLQTDLVALEKRIETVEELTGDT